MIRIQYALVFITALIFAEIRAQNVGIGTTTPQSSLHLYDAQNEAVFRLSNSVTSQSSGIELAIDQTSAARLWQIENARLDFGTNNTLRLAISADGNVGIGITNPSTKLDVDGVIRSSSLTGAADAYLLVDADGNLMRRIELNGDSTHVLNGTGELISLAGLVADGDSDPTNELDNTDSQQLSLSNNDLSISGGNTVSLQSLSDHDWYVTGGTGIPGSIGNSIYTNGSVGVGTSSPQANFHVDGGAIGDAMLIIEADTDNSNEEDNALMRFIQDDGLIQMEVGFCCANVNSGNVFRLSPYASGSFDSLAFTLNGTNSLIGIGTDVAQYNLDVRGTIGGNGVLYHSDRRWKQHIEPIDDALNLVSRLQGRTYHWKTDEFKHMKFSAGKQYGFIAQEVEAIVPDLVHTTESGYKGVAYANMTALLVEAVKELKAENQQLRAEVEALSAIELRMANLEMQIANLQGDHKD